MVTLEWSFDSIASNRLKRPGTENGLRSLREAVQYFDLTLKFRLLFGVYKLDSVQV